MKAFCLSRYALLACCVAVAACSQPTELSRSQYAPNAGVPQRSETALKYGVLYSFGARNGDGSDPDANLTDQNGTLFGTTYGGGAYGGGTVFSITTGGTEKVLHSFGQGTDGSHPVARLIDENGTLFGTTIEGGANSCGSSTCGTVFSITKDGTETVLHSFGQGTDGSSPTAGLIDKNGTLYGTTAGGGANGAGTVFSITTGGTENVLHSFGQGADGSNPQARLLEESGTLYGTTYKGGAYGAGTVFTITTGGAEKVLHSFGQGSDCSNPQARLIDESGTLYGTTYHGGANGGSLLGGTVFSITKSGTEKVLHSFGKGNDGVGPAAGLVDVSGTLYGTTFQGGANHYCLGFVTCGTVFSITTAGTEKVLHDFGNGTDGFAPQAGLTDVNGTLYGTTNSGGAYGRGTIFSITP